MGGEAVTFRMEVEVEVGWESFIGAWTKMHCTL